MYSVERDTGPDQWARETCFQTEFKAFVHARTKSLATGNTYRVLFSSPSKTGEVLRVLKGKALLDTDDQLFGKPLVLRHLFRHRRFSLMRGQSSPVAFAAISFLPPSSINLWAYPETKQLRVHLLG